MSSARDRLNGEAAGVLAGVHLAAFVVEAVLWRWPWLHHTVVDRLNPGLGLAPSL